MGYNMTAWMSCDFPGCEERIESTTASYCANLAALKAGWKPGYRGAWFCPAHASEWKKSFPVPAPDERRE